MTIGLLRLCQIDPPLSPCLSAMVSLVRNALLRFDRASLAPIVTCLPLGLINSFEESIKHLQHLNKGTRGVSLYCNHSKSVKNAKEAP